MFKPNNQKKKKGLECQVLLYHILLVYAHCPWNNVYEKFMAVVKGGTFNVHMKQTVDIPVMDQAGGSTRHTLEYCIVQRIQNSLDIMLSVWTQISLKTMRDFEMIEGCKHFSGNDFKCYTNAFFKIG